MRHWPPKERVRSVWWNIVEENERPWKPMPGMVKRRCEACTLWYAKPIGRDDGDRCPDCQLSYGV